MAYVAVKGGEQAILNSHRLIAEDRRGVPEVPELTVSQIAEQLGLAVDRVMCEGSVYDRELAALALKQAQGDAVEAIFLLRAFRTTLPRFAVSNAIDTDRMAIQRRISATFKDVPGGQVLGSTYEYTHRLLDFDLLDNAEVEETKAELAATPLDDNCPRAFDSISDEGLIEAEVPAPDEASVFDLTREPLALPAGRDQRLQNLARGDEGFVVGLAYSALRGYGAAHPYVGETRVGDVAIEVVPEELGFPVSIGDITVAECQMLDLFAGTDDEPARFTRGYGLSFGKSERKAMGMAIVDRSLRSSEYGEDVKYPAQDEEFVLSHTDNLEAAGFVSHLTLPHYVDFQGDLQFIRRLREEQVCSLSTKEAAE
ncbi:MULTISPECIES: carbon-phosphorus lyase complex subunit PhnI [Sinorhizobium]|uniref:Carbon-phosphorus lyase complex subunit PhnI n=1 Tax=Sinorhizobium americanum TaxID=194963 RepID=A0A2S3YR47_9HYPH|nr:MULTISPECIES: carbon-phosphorus lyase complex subunit PhnI [Sinorhizobium]PDT35856.1 carbon-phosphorus lyase complex subunit PhnI [Sinorhizobium sp. FG01]PDT50661.1 carbon-phosphorus lyase complex subunit PhnI [Sinorhizobium sp. NG07B]POH33943.1 carbon-phosphorus lyase complex subunit PhnI [Sinorhizobium americanum]POH34008.1 carbon-phosphorus lyase complex subunit PhnI [Sinorhizobium americanum]